LHTLNTKLTQKLELFQEDIDIKIHKLIRDELRITEITLEPNMKLTSITDLVANLYQEKLPAVKE